MSISSTKITKAITLKPGEPFKLPDGATVVYASDVAGLSSTCDNLPATASLKCWVVSWKQNSVDIPAGFLVNASFTAIILNGVEYNITARTDGAQWLHTELAQNPETKYLLIPTCAKNEDLNSESSCFIKFTLPDNFSAPKFRIIDNNSSGNSSPIELTAYASDNCSDCTSFPAYTI